MAFYESVFIARQDIAAPQVETLTDTFSKIIENEGGAVKKTEYWGLRSLAYRIKKNRKGHYVLMNLDTPASAVVEMERQMRINEDVLRYMTVRVEELEEESSVIMRHRNNDDRPRRGFKDDGEDDGTKDLEKPAAEAEESSEADASSADSEKGES